MEPLDALFKKFGLVTPYMSKFEPRRYESIEGVIYITETSLSIPAVSMQVTLERKELPDPSVFGDETLLNIVGKSRAGLSHWQLLDLVREKLARELLERKSWVSCCPLLYLMYGILYQGNWKYLSEEDFNLFVKAYGVGKKRKELQLASIITLQNGMLRELYQYGYTNENQGGSLTLELIQSQYDPDRIARSKNPNLYQLLWEGSPI
ncbi:MAG: hypothetical protein ACE5NG_18790 [bacterium]